MMIDIKVFLKRNFDLVVDGETFVPIRGFDNLISIILRNPRVRIEELSSSIYYSYAIFNILIREAGYSKPHFSKERNMLVIPISIVVSEMALDPYEVFKFIWVTKDSVDVIKKLCNTYVGFRTRSDAPKNVKKVSEFFLGLPSPKDVFPKVLVSDLDPETYLYFDSNLYKKYSRKSS